MITKSKKLFILFLLLITSISEQSFSQWAYDPSVNTKIVVDPNDPVNIISVEDGKGGAYIVWQDIKRDNKQDIFFLHLNKDGEVTFRSDGKAVSLSNQEKSEPKIQLLPSGDLLIFWKEKISSSTSELFAQKVSSKGQRLWSDYGIQISRLNNELIDFAFDSDRNGNTIIALVIYTEKDLRSSVFITKLNNEGKIAREPFELANSLSVRFGECNVHQLADSLALLTWIETKNSKATLNFGRLTIGQDSVSFISKRISKTDENIIKYQTAMIDDKLYVIRYSQEKQKVIYHHLLDSYGNFIWGKDGMLLTSQRGHNSNPQFAIYNGKIFVTWVNDYQRNKNIYAQLFGINGNKLWQNAPVPVIEYQGEQFGQKTIADGKGNFIVAWIDRRFTKQFGNIYAQKINEEGKLQWPNTGVDLGTHRNSEKSYLNLIPDNQGGAIAIFKDRREKKSEIFGQKIYSTGTYAGQILGLKAELEGDSVKIFWYAANEKDDYNYQVQRTVNSPDNWYTIKEVPKGPSSSINYYEIKDITDSSGTVSYRVIQTSSENQQISESVDVDVVKEQGDYILYQNVPNPFNTSTVINFTIANEEYVEIELFDIKLNSLGLITRQVYPAGKNSVTFNASELSPGIYFYKMKAGDFVAVKKMVVSK